MTKILVGADPEIFVGKDGKFVSAHNLLPGTKEEPYKVECGAVQVDGMAAEFNIDPAGSEAEFLHNLDVVIQQLHSMMPDVEFLPVSSVEFSVDFAKSVPFTALELGCDPDFNAYTGQTNPKPNMFAMMRTAGGHIHIGGFESDNIYETNHFNDMSRLTMAMDEEVGVYSLAWDENDSRRRLYGQAGSFRPKSYGVEYRTLSNAWLFNKDLQKFVYQGVFRALDKFFDRGWVPTGLERNIINSSNRKHKFFQSNPLWNTALEIAKG